jgi:FkbM family methyltransferase
MRDEPWLHEWAPLIGVGGVAFDVGANSGTWTKWLEGRFASIVSLEPDDRCEPPAGAKYDNRAVWHTTGAAVLFLRDQALQSSLKQLHPVGDGGRQVNVVETAVVPTVTLDDLAGQYGMPDFIKIDIEGAEADALAGATLPCFSSCRWVVELHDTRAEVVSHFARLGYSEVKIIPHPHERAAPGHEWLLAVPDENHV